ncbi:unnamed protein product [Rotaria sp. Silwood2]|nr:unnamed protein product [Rotaria sp. Silwood2]CAF4668813.1 unnamed protein product [Rotaria sp. Silwood2]
MKMKNKQLEAIDGTLLEYLSNEISIEILFYLNGIDLIFAFSCLINRFQSLLSNYCEFFDFKSISKAKFDLIFRQYDTQRWKSLEISNDDHTYGQIDNFFQKYFLIKNFFQLRSFSMLKIKVGSGYTFFNQLEFLTNLNSLTIESICGSVMSKFNLPKLRRFVLSSCRNMKWIKVIL